MFDRIKNISSKFGSDIQIDKEGWVSLKALDPIKEQKKEDELSQGVVSIDSETMKILKINSGDHVMIQGARYTFAQCLPLNTKKKGVMMFNKSVAINLGLLDDFNQEYGLLDDENHLLSFLNKGVTLDKLDYHRVKINEKKEMFLKVKKLEIENIEKIIVTPLNHAPYHGDMYYQMFLEEFKNIPFRKGDMFYMSLFNNHTIFQIVGILPLEGGKVSSSTFLTVETKESREEMQNVWKSATKKIQAKTFLDNKQEIIEEHKFNEFEFEKYIKNECKFSDEEWKEFRLEEGLGLSLVVEDYERFDSENVDFDVDWDTAESLGFTGGEDIIEITGKRKTVARCMTSCRKNTDSIKMGKYVRLNAGVEIGDMVSIKKTSALPAEKIVVYPTDEKYTDINPEFFEGFYRLNPVYVKGDKFERTVSGREMDIEGVVKSVDTIWRIVKTIPDEIVFQTKDTKFEIQKQED